MGTFSIWHWLIVLAVVLILFGGGGKIPRLMGDVARGVKSFKSGLKEDKVEEEEEPEPAKSAKRVSESKSKSAGTRAKGAAKKRKTGKS